MRTIFKKYSHLIKPFDIIIVKSSSTSRMTINIILLKSMERVFRDKEDSSPDQIAVQTGWVSQPGQTSICLPHGLMIEIISTEPATSDNDTIIPL